MFFSGRLKFTGAEACPVATYLTYVTLYTFSADPPQPRPTTPIEEWPGLTSVSRVLLVPDPETGRYEKQFVVPADTQYVEFHRDHGDIYSDTGNFNSAGGLGLAIGPNTGVGLDIDIDCPYVEP